MKNNIIVFGWILLMMFFVSCNSDSWDDHYDSKNIKSTSFEVYYGAASDYMEKTSSLSEINEVFKAQGVYDSVGVEDTYTFIAYDNSAMDMRPSSLSDSLLALSCVSDISISPSNLFDGIGILTGTGKNVWVSIKNDSLYFDVYKVNKAVKTENGYIYIVDKVIPVRQSVYEYMKGLGSDYSEFKKLVADYEEVYFDEENSTKTGVNAMGNSIYDTVWAVRNNLMDRYTSDGLKKWDMRSEDYVSTMFIPSNDVIDKALKSAFDSIPVWLNKEVTSNDTLKFKKWIVEACFVGHRLTDNDVAVSGSDITCVDGYRKIIDKSQDSETFDPIDPAYWRPSVQKADLSSKVSLSNGVAYYITDFKIPNHVVIYRVKSKFYQLWDASTSAEKEKYFRWTNWVEPMIVENAQSSFQLSTTLPTMYYHVLTAIPSDQAIADSSVCSVTYDGLMYNSETNVLTEAHLPAGEYYLRMGFKHSLRYSIDILFDDSLIVEDMMLYAQGSNFHFDRGSVSSLDYYGNSSIGFPEGYDWRDWIELNPKAVAYDTDGYQVGVVNIKKNGNFTITIRSKDESYLYNSSNGRTKNNVTQLMMYHWCLRPTTNNY